MRLALKIQFYRNVIAEMTGNEYFPNPDVSMADLTAALNEFENNYFFSRAGSDESFIKLRQSQKAADDLFRKTAKYVDRIANGNKAIIISSGFVESGQPSSSRRSIFSVKNSDLPCQIIVRCKAVSGAKAYCWQSAETEIPEKDKGWTYAGVSTQATFTIVELTSLKKYWFRFCAVKSSGMTAWSEPIMKLVI